MTNNTCHRVAIAALFETRYRYVAKMARNHARLTGDDVNDLIGAAWLEVVRCSERLAAEDWDMALIVTMTRRAMFSVSRKSRRARQELPLAVVEMELADRTTEPLDEMIHAEGINRLRVAYAQLKETDRLALATHYGLDGREPQSAGTMAELLGKSCSRTAQYTVQAARRRLAERMGE